MSSEVIDIARHTVASKERVAVRDPVVDVARGIAILLVVLGHNRAISQWSSHLVDVIFLFHVPLFFLLSGYVCRDEQFSIAVRKLARRLLAPCFAAALLVGSIKSIVREESLLRTLMGIAWATGQTLPWAHLWFLPTLFLSLMVARVARRGVGERPSAWAAGVLLLTAVAAIAPQPDAAVAGFSFTYPVGLPWGLDLLGRCLIFVFLGQLLQISPWLERHVRTPVFGLAAAVVFACSATVAATDLNLRIFTPFLPALLAAVSGCVLALNAAALICHSALLARTLACIGRHTLPIFLFHVSIQKALLQIDTGHVLPSDAVWVRGVLTAMLAVLTSIMIERYLLARVGLLRYLFLPGRAA